MRKVIPVVIMILMAVVLSACSLSFSGNNRPGEPTLSDVQMQTQIAALLTAQPTATGESLIPMTATPGLPTAESTQPPTSTPEPEQAPAEVTATPTEEQQTEATATPEATAAIQGDANAGGGGPTPTPPPTLTPQAGGGGPTATPSPDDPRNRLGAATSTDAMNDSSSWVWPTGYSDYTSVKFTNGAMVLTSTDTISGWRLANPAGREFGNLYLEATVTTGNCKGNDQYGLITRVPVLKDADKGYLFGFTCDGRYSFRSWDGTVGEKGKMTRLVDWKSSPAINAGSGKTNRIGLMMLGNRMLMYANGTLLGEVTTGTYPSGYFGVFVGGIQTSGFAITVDEMAYWENPKP